ncbi:MAG: Divalent-cation tolerance protein CutA [Verrucomicrobiota bacterium]|jgi:periplasmic divalent cation tolerance protein
MATSPTTDDVLVAWTTLPSKEEAETLAAAAVAARLAACAQVEGPLRSHFIWEGVAQAEEEFRVTFKLAAAQEAALRTWVHGRHPYAVPQWLAVPATHVSPAYQAWVLGIR